MVNNAKINKIRFGLFITSLGSLDYRCSGLFQRRWRGCAKRASNQLSEALWSSLNATDASMIKSGAADPTPARNAE
jgi:hypothetical protein